MKDRFEQMESLINLWGMTTCDKSIREQLLEKCENQFGLCYTQ